MLHNPPALAEGKAELAEPAPGSWSLFPWEGQMGLSPSSKSDAFERARREKPLQGAVALEEPNLRSQSGSGGALGSQGPSAFWWPHSVLGEVTRAPASATVGVLGVRGAQCPWCSSQ